MNLIKDIRTLDNHEVMTVLLNYVSRNKGTIKGLEECTDVAQRLMLIVQDVVARHPEVEHYVAPEWPEY